MGRRFVTTKYVVYKTHFFSETHDITMAESPATMKLLSPVGLPKASLPTFIESLTLRPTLS